MPLNVHDALFKSTFSDTHHAEGALQSALPTALTGRIDWSTLELEPGSFVDEDLKDRHTDLLFSASLAGRRALLYLLYEHQSKPHPLMPFRLLAYLVRIWEGWLKKNPTAKRLPAIVPVVLHHGDGGWNAARALEELYDLDAEALAAAGEHIVRLRFPLDDLDAESDEALRARAMSALGRLVLYCLRHTRDPAELIRGLSAWVDLVREVRAAPNGAAALATVWRYILLIDEQPPEIVLQQLAAATRDGNRQEDLMTAGEVLMQRGELRGQRRMLLKQLTARFGPVPAWAAARIDGAGEAELDAWANRVLTAASLEESLGS
jgi:hypothetical protein